MDTPEAEPKKAFSARFIISRALAALLVLVFVLVVSGYSYLVSPRGTARISAILSASLHLPVTISRIGLSGDILDIRGVNVGNPPGFSDKPLVSIDSIRVAPDWQRLLTGRRALRLVAVDGAKLEIRKGGAGDWNVSELRKRFTGGGGAELFIGELKVTGGDILVNGKGLRRVSLTLRDLATKGSAASGIRLAFADESGNRYALNGRFRPGAHPEADLELAAPSIAFSEVAGPEGPGAVRLSGGSGSLLLRGGLRNGIVRTTLEATVSRAAIRIHEREILMLSGRVGGSATYDLKADSMVLEDLSLVVKEMLDIRATGRASGLKSGARYDLLVAVNSLDLGKASTLVPAVATSGAKLGGKVTSDGVKVAGGVNGGLSEVAGKVSLHGLSLARGKILLVAGVGTEMTLATVNGRVKARGELVQESGTARPLLERINAPYALAFSGGLKPESLELTRFTARLMGTPLNGSARLRPGAREPFSILLRVPEKSLEAGSFGDLTLDSGAVGASLELHGAGPREFRGALDVSLRGIDGNVKGGRFTVGSSKLTAALGRNRGQYSVSGDVALGRGSFKGTDVAGRFGFKASDGKLRIEDGTVTVGGAAITVPEMSAAIPQRGPAGLAKGFPVDLALSGGAVRRGEVDLAGISGSLAGYYADVDGARRFDGAGVVAVKSVLWRGREIGGQKAELAVSRAGANARLGGPVLGGSLDGSLSFDPFAAARGVAFDLSLKGVELAKLSWLFERKGRASFPAGQLSLSSRGDYSAGDGVRCRISGDGEGIAISDGKGKVVLSGATLRFDGSLAQGKMLLPEALLRIGEGAAVSMKGEIANVLSMQREGTIAVDLPRTRVDRIVDPFANALPRLLQEASVAGDVAAHALLTVRDGRGRVDGLVQLDDAGIDAESQKLKVEGVSGEVPFSVGFPAAGKAVPGRRAEWRREEYDQRLEQLKNRPASGSLLTIGRLGFGPMELKETSLRLRAAEGIIEAVQFSSKLTTAAILGQGYLALSGGGYGGDFVLNDLSLQQLCDLFPKIKGYVSGRLDGLARVEGRGGGGGPNGSLYLWAREGDGEKMLVSRAFLQKLAGKNLQGFFFRDDRPFDTGEVRASLEGGYLTFDILDISHTNIFGVRDLKVSVTDTQNRIAMDHLMDSIRQAAGRAKKEPGAGEPGEPAATPEFKWDE